MLIADLARRKGEVGHLQQQEASDEALAQAVVTDNPRTQRCHGCGNQCNRRKAPVQGVIDQGDVQWRENGKQQNFRHGQVAERAVQAQIGHTELQHTGDQYTQLQASGNPTPTGQRQKHQGGKHHTGQYREIAVHTPGQKFANQTERKRPQDCYENQKTHITRT